MYVNMTGFLNENKKNIEREISKIVPRKLNKKWLKSIIFDEKYLHLKSLEQEISKPLWDFLDRGGKRWRPTLLLLSCKAMKGNENKALALSPLPELIHNGTIIVDDIEDNALMRRNKKALHLIYGIDTAINTGNLLYFIGLQILLENKARLSERQLRKAYELYARELIAVSFGQALDIRWHKSNYIPSEKEYLKMVALKTGSLSRFAAELGAIAANANEKHIKLLGNFAESIGMAFQIQDDILNIMPSKESGWGKELGEDISEGKKSLIVIKALKELNAKEKKELLRILKEKTKNKRKVFRAIELIKKTNAIAFAQKKANAIVMNAWEKLKKVLPETKEKLLLKEIAEYFIRRKV